jgi:hypothetical protein
MYQLPPDFMSQLSQCVKRMSDGAFIPCDLANRDYQEYLEWIKAGNTPLPAED